MTESTEGRPMFHVKHPHSFHTRSLRIRNRRLPLLAALASLALVLSGCVGIAVPLGWAPPVVVEDALLVQVAPGQVAYMDTATHSTVWRFPQEQDRSNPFYATPLVDGGTVYLAGYNGLVRRVDVAGNIPQQQWEVNLERRVVATPVLHDGTLFVPTEEGVLERITADNGARGQAIVTGETRIWGAPVVVDGVIYVGDLDSGATLAIDPATGEQLWEQTAVGASAADLVAADGRLYVASFDRSLHVLDLADGGNEAWSFRGDGWFMGPPLVEGDTVYITSMRGTVYALDAASGALRWQQTIEEREFRSAPVLAGGSLVVVDRKGLVAGLDPSSGERQWTTVIPDVEFNAHPTVRGADIYLVSSKHDLLRVDASNAGASQRLLVSN